MNATTWLLCGFVWLTCTGCSLFTGSNFFLPTEPEATQAMSKKPERLPPYTASEAQDAVTVAAVREFFADATRSTGTSVKEIFLGVGAAHSDPDAALLSRLASIGLTVRPLSVGIRAEVATTLGNSSTPPPLRVALAIDSGSHSGASRQYSISATVRATPSSKHTSGFHPSSLDMRVMSADVQSGSPGRFGMWIFSPPSSSTSRFTDCGLPAPRL